MAETTANNLLLFILMMPLPQFMVIQFFVFIISQARIKILNCIGLQKGSAYFAGGVNWLLNLLPQESTFL